MLKRKRFHPDETYDSMVVTYSSDDAVKVDPVHGNGKFECTLNNPNSITHARKLLPLRAHVPNSYNNVTEGQNTLQFGQILPEGEFEISAANNTNVFKMYYTLEVTVAHGAHLVGDQVRLPAFGWVHGNSVTSSYRYATAVPELHVTIPDGTYTLSTFTTAFDAAIHTAIQSAYDRTGFGEVYWLNEWLQGGKNFVDPTQDSGWKTMEDHVGGTPQQTVQFTYVNGKVQFEIHNAFATDLTTNIDKFGVPNVPQAPWPNRMAHVFGPPFVNPGPWVEWIDLPLSLSPDPTLDSDKYVIESLDIELTTEQQTLFGHTVSPVVFGGPSGLPATAEGSITFKIGTDVVTFPGTSTSSFYPQSLSAPITIPPGYYTAAQLADTIDTLLKATTEPADFEWLHRIRDYYNGGGQDADVDLRRCELVNDVFRFYFTPLLDGVVAPSDLVTTYTYENTYNEAASAPISTVSLVGSSSLLRLLGFADDNELQLPTDSTMTIYQSVDGGCVNMDIPYVYITSPQISRNNVLTSDSRNRNILAAIPMTGVPRCDYAHYTGVDIYVDNIDYKGPTSLDKVEFEVTDDKHNVLTIPTHTPVTISLKVYHDDTDP
jgi:hypothetical protein